MLIDFLKAHVGENTAPFVAIALFVVIVGVSLWLTPKIAKGVDGRRKETTGFYDGMLEQQPENEDKDN